MTKTYLLLYLEKCPKHDSGGIFITSQMMPLNQNAIKGVFYKIRKKTGINVSAHKLRHNFATNWLVIQYQAKGTADIYQLMLILGHEDIKTTQIYVHMAQQIVLGMQNYSKLDSIAKMRGMPFSISEETQKPT